MVPVQLVFVASSPWKFRLERRDENVHLNSHFVKELRSVCTHRLLDLMSSLNFTKSLRIVFSEVLNSSFHAFTFLGVFTQRKNKTCLDIYES